MTRLWQHSFKRYKIMASKHYMMLSDLYGRIGQILREHGDAPIGQVRTPLFPDEPRHPIEWVKPLYCEVTQFNTEIDGVNIKPTK